VFLCTSSTGFGWGPYAHQQIHRLAMRLSHYRLQGWMRQNERAVMRLSMTPDIDWKSFGDAPADRLAAFIQQNANTVEAPTHFFDSDIFAKRIGPDGKPDFSHLYGLTRYSDALPVLSDTVSANRRFLDRATTGTPLVDWNRPLPEQMANLGSGPWRVLQVAEKAIAALTAEREYEALVYLSALGHYLSDLAVPQHTSVYFDGNSKNSKGVHLGFELKMLDYLANRAGSFKDPVTELYPSFAATETAVRVRVMEQGVSPRIQDSADLLKEVLTVVADGYPLLEPLAEAYEKAKANHTDLGKEWEPFLESRLALASGEVTTVRETALKRMADATRLTAATWNYVFDEATRRLGRLPRLEATHTFDRARAIHIYPFPTYLKEAPRPVAAAMPSRVSEPVGNRDCRYWLTRLK